MRYLGTDLEELNADVVVDNNRVFQDSSYTVLSPADPRMKEKDLVGLKAVGLAILNSLKGINVPRFTVITTKAYLGFLQSRPDISYMITRLEELKNPEEVEILRERIMRAIEAAEIPNNIRTEIIFAYQKVRAKGLISIRSSATKHPTCL